MYSYDSVMSGPSEWKFIENLKYLPPPVTDEQLMKTESPNTAHEVLMNHLSKKFLEMWGSAPSEAVQEQKVEAENPKLYDEGSIKHLSDLLKEKEALAKVPESAEAQEKIDKEITEIRDVLETNEFEGAIKVELPEDDGEEVTLMKKYYVPVHLYPGYNFAGRILGPRGQTARQFEKETGCKISVRGKGRDNRKAIATYGHNSCFEDELHVVVWCRDTKIRAQLKLDHALEHVIMLLTPAPEEIRRKQLTKLALLNNKYRRDYQW